MKGSLIRFSYHLSSLFIIVVHFRYHLSSLIVYYWWPLWGSWTRPAPPPMTPREQRRFCFQSCLFCFFVLFYDSERAKKVLFLIMFVLFLFFVLFFGFCFLFCFYDSERAKKVLFSLMCSRLRLRAFATGTITTKKFVNMFTVNVLRCSKARLRRMTAGSTSWRRT